MEEVTQTCVVCRGMQASQFCLCEGRETFLCDACLIPHQTNTQGCEHQPIPIAVYGKHTIPGYIDRLRTRTSQFSLGKEEMMKNLLAIDSCILEFSQKVTNIIETLNNFAEAKIMRLRELRGHLERDISAAVAEVEATLFADAPILHAKLSKKLIDFMEHSQPVHLFSYTIDRNPFPDSIGNILQVSKGETQLFPIAKERNLLLQDLMEKRTTRIALPVKFSEGAMTCVVDDQTVVCIGGNGVSDVYFVSIPTREVKKTENMKGGRGHFGILKYETYVYAFGGYTRWSRHKSCEKMDLRTRTWSSIHSMSVPRAKFTPCLYGKDIYLPDTNMTDARIETFNILSEKFTILSVQLPQFRGTSVSCILNGELCLINDIKMLYRWKINSAETGFREEQIQCEEGQTCSNGPPVLVGKKLYWVNYASLGLICFQFEKLSVLDEVLEDGHIFAVRTQVNH